MMSTFKREEAMRLLEEGNRRHQHGDIEGAKEKYKESIQVHPTADAHTFLGWMYGIQGRLRLAIRHCEIAIDLDPDSAIPTTTSGSI